MTGLTKALMKYNRTLQLKIEKIRFSEGNGSNKVIELLTKELKSLDQPKINGWL